MGLGFEVIEVNLDLMYENSDTKLRDRAVLLPLPSRFLDDNKGAGNLVRPLTYVICHHSKTSRYHKFLIVLI